MNERDSFNDGFRRIGGQPLDYSATSGAVDAADAMYDANSLEYNTISNSSTTLDPTDVEGDKYEHLKDLNDGQYSNEYQSQRRSKHRLFDLRHYCESLELPSSVMKDLYTQFEDIDFNDFGPHDAETVLLALISLVANEHDIAVRDSSPITNDHRATVYENIRHTTNTSTSDIRTARKLIQENDNDCEDHQHKRE